MYFDCIISGFGGQGVMLAGNILAYAGMCENKNVTYMPVYGVEMRGGTANCTVVISDKEIGSPIIQKPICSIVMNRPSLEKFGPRVKQNGILIVNASLIPKEDVNFPNVECIMVPARELAMEIGNEKLLNMIILGATVQKTKVVSMDSLIGSLPSALDPRYHHLIDINVEALQQGAAFIDQH
ncbi:MAG: 2-oxoacid:acceptor oxidoreductase family protein [Desulfobacterales bacterium]|nr:2-oxoacid:acceptor oxidoreductase family protein [Desulfobacterales bacterium]